MKSFSPYLIFDGQTREAMTFYKDCLGATLDIQSYADAPAPAAPGSEDRTIHAKLTVGDAVIMASDSQNGMKVNTGDNFFVSIDCGTDGEVDALAGKLSAGGAVLMAAQDTFWGARFAMVRDRFGVGWMFNHDKPKAG